MEQLNISAILQRPQCEAELDAFFADFYKNKSDAKAEGAKAGGAGAAKVGGAKVGAGGAKAGGAKVGEPKKPRGRRRKSASHEEPGFTQQKGLFVYGQPGCGKTHFIKDYLKRHNYDMLYFDSTELRNKSLLNTINEHNMSSVSVLDMMYRKPKKIVIVMDEVEMLNLTVSDKAVLTELTHLVKIKKTKKQKLKDSLTNPIICISNNVSEKKVKELMGVCEQLVVPPPTPDQMAALYDTVLGGGASAAVKSRVVAYLDGDLRKLSMLHSIKSSATTGELPTELLQHLTRAADDVKEIVRSLYKENHPLATHKSLVSENNRTTMGLLWHENIVDVLGFVASPATRTRLYNEFLKNICFSDYLDRITFQKQIWQCNELSSLVKVYYSNHLWHQHLATVPPATRSAVVGDIEAHITVDQVRFTKILTKYSTEYNNTNFMTDLCDKLTRDVKDVYNLFMYLKEHDPDVARTKHEDLLAHAEVTKLDINRIYKMIDYLY